MEHTYRVADREAMRTIGIGFLLGGLLFVTLGISAALGLPFLDVRESSRLVVSVLPIAIGSVVAYIGWNHLVRQPWMVQTRADGSIAVYCAIGSTRLVASRIVALDRSRRKVGVEDEDARTLKIVHTGGAIPVAWFPGVEELIADIRALNPMVAMLGSWEPDRR